MKIQEFEVTKERHIRKMELNTIRNSIDDHYGIVGPESFKD